MIGVGTTEEIAGSRSSSPRARRQLADPVAATRRRAQAEIAGAPVALERPAEAEHGDYATNVALQACGGATAAAARDRGGDRGRGRRSRARGVERRWQGPGSSTSGSRTRGSPRRWARSSTAGDAFGAGSAAAARAGPGRDGLREPDRADHGRERAERRLRRLGGAAARVRRARGRARVLLQRRRRADGALPRVRRGDPPRRGAARGRLSRRVRRRSSPRCRAIPCLRCWPHRGVARALPDPLRLVERESEVETGDSRGDRAPRHVRGGRARSGRGRARTATSKDRVLVRSDGAPTYFAAGRRVHRRKYAGGFDRLDLRARRRPPRLRRRGCRRSRRCSATTASRSRCSSTSSSTSSRAARASEDVQAPRRRRLPRRAARRDRRRRRALVPRLARARPDDRARRRPRRGADEEEPRLLRAVRARADRGDLAERRRDGSRPTSSRHGAARSRSASS